MKARLLPVCAAAAALALWLVFAPAPTGAAGPTVVSEPESVSISALKDGGAFEATFYLSSTVTITGLLATVDPLNPAAGQPADLPPISPSKVTIAAADGDTQLDAGKREPWTVTVESVPAYGQWSGNMVFQWSGAVTGTLRVPLTVEATSKPALAVYDPAKIVVKGDRGEVYTRTLMLHETVGGSAVTGLRCTLSDFYEKDQDDVLPPEKIACTVAGRAEPSGYPTATVVVHLDGVAAGSYAHKLLITSDNADDLSVDLDVSVKRRPWGALGVLVAGLILAIAITSYLEHGLKTDRVRDALVKARKALADDAELRQYCGTWFAEKDAETLRLLSEKKEDEAQKSVDQALSFYNGWWSQLRDQYLGNVDKAKELIRVMTAPAPYVARLRRYLEEMIAGAKIPAYAGGPNDMLDDIRRMDGAWSLYEQAAAGLKALRDELDKSPLLDREDRQKIQQALEGPDGKGGIAAALAAIPEPTIEGKKDTGWPPVPVPAELTKAQADLAAQRAALGSAVAQGQECERRYLGCEKEARELLPGLSSPSNLVEKAVSAVLTEAGRVWGAGRLKAAAGAAQNAWYAADHERHLFARARDLGDSDLAPALGEVDKFVGSAAAWVALEPGADAAADTFYGKMKGLREAVIKAAVEELGDYLPPADLPLWVPPQQDEMPAMEVVSAPPGREYPAHEPRRAPSGWQKAWLSISPKARIWLFRITTFVVGLVILGMVGYKQQYVDNDTFGSVTDYIALFLWGFGTEVGRDKVMTLLESWNLKVGTG